MSAEEGVFVGSGSFLVDRGQALDKLMRFQLPNPAAFALAWARCASASGASHFMVTADAGLFTATFDGRPLTKEELEDPYRCLFETRTDATDRNRQLAVGLLSVLRLKPASIRLTSGPGTERRCLSVDSLESEHFEDATPGGGTVLTVAWPALAYAAAREAADLVRSGCILSKMEIAVDGAVLPGWTEGHDERQYFQDDAVRGWVAVPGEASEDSELELCWHGTVVEKITMKLPLVQVKGAVNDDGFVLNASQSGVVRDARFDAALKRLAEPARALILATTRALALKPVGPVLQDLYFRRRWREILEEGEDGQLARPFDTVVNAAQTLWTMASGDGPGSSKEEALVKRAGAVRWLRRLCARRLRPRSKASPDDVINALWSAPLYVGADGSPLSLDDLAAQQKRLSYIPYCDEPAPGLSLPFRPLWSVSSGEAELAGRLLDAPVRDVTPTVEELKRDPRGRGGAASFEEAGLPVPLIRASIALGAIAGEAGLSSMPEKKGRLHLLTQGLPSGVVELDGRLRFEAVVADPARRWEENPLTAHDADLCKALVDLARTESLKLYRRLAQEHDPNASSARAAAIRAHLLDYLGDAVLKDADDPDAWIRKVPLFEGRDGRWVDHDFAAAALANEPLYAARQGQEYAWQDGKNLILAPDLNGERLTSLFPGCVGLPILGRSGVFALVPGLARCDRSPAGGRCVASFRLGLQAVHGVLPASVDTADFSWDKLTLHPSGGAGADLAGHPEIIVELLLALVRQAGPLLEAPDDPLRFFFLKGLSLAPAPWPGAAGKALWETLKGRPVFRSPYTAGRTLEDVFAALNAPGGRLTYAAAATTTGPQPDVLLDEHELETLRRFQPLGSESLQPLGMPARPRPVALPTEPEEPAPSNFLSVFRGKPAVRANERFFIERRYGGRGLDVWFGLSTRLPPPAAAFVEDGAAPFDLSGLPPLASILVDIPPGLAPENGPAALMGFLRQFYEEIAARWPVAKLQSPGYAVSQRYVLEALRLSAEKPALFDGWKPVLRKIRGLKLFTVLGGGLLSLDELSELVAEDGVLLFADPALPATSVTGDRVIPVLRNPKLVAEILAAKGPVKVKRFRPVVAEPAHPVFAGRPIIIAEPPASAAAAPPDDDAAPDEPRPPEDLAVRLPVVEAAFRLLAGLSGRKGLKLPRHELSDLRLDHGFEGTLLIKEGSWTLNSDDALVKAILGSSLPPEEQSAYLASVAYTASNRLKNMVTDLDDIRFQEALADTL
jgi:hypothetical protein